MEREAVTQMKISRFAGYAWLVLAYNVLVILWGAFVRATGSGAGCGRHWPTCNGEVIPRAPQLETIIEFTHRLSSGLALFLVIGLFIWAYRSYRQDRSVWLGARFSLFFIITEALVGAGLVLFEWVAHDASLGRAISIVVHLLNTFMLLAALTLTAWWASGGAPVVLRSDGVITWALAIGVLGTLLMGASGALAALGDTLFPARSLVEGIQQDFSPTAHFLVRLRVLHPTIAVITGIWLIVTSGMVAAQWHGKGVRFAARLLTVLIVVQLGAGVLNLFLLAPVWMQLVHLLLADAVWMALVVLCALVFARQPDATRITQSDGKLAYSS